MRPDNGQIAARLRGLLSGQGEPQALAARLRVDETALRMSIDLVSPYPTLDVIAAVVREYAVDPNWLITGEYDSGSHRAAIEAATAEMPAVVNGVVQRITNTPPHNLRIVR
jgi:hypothetical protein